MSEYRLLGTMDRSSDAYRLRLEKLWAEIQAKAQAVEAKRAQTDTEQPQPPQTTKSGPPIGWMAEHEARQDELEDELREAFAKLKPPGQEDEKIDTP